MSVSSSIHQETALTGNFRANRKKLVLLSLAWLIPFSSLEFLYRRSLQQWHVRQKQLLSVLKWPLSQSFKHYQQFLNLLEFRLRHAIEKGNVENILQILSQKIEALEELPELTSLTFAPSGQPEILYSRLGKRARSPSEIPVQDKTASLGRGNFETRRTLYGNTGKILGSLQVTFSFCHLLQRHISLDELVVIPASQASAKGALFFGVQGLPFLFVLKRMPPSAWAFFSELKFYLLFLTVLASTALGYGIFYGRVRSTKSIRHRKERHRLLTEEVGLLQRQNAQKCAEIEKLTHLLQLKSKATKGKIQLFILTQERFKQIAMQALALNNLLTKILADETSKNCLAPEIPKTAQETSELLKRLVKKHPIPETNPAVDISASFEKIRTFFLPEMTERGLAIQVVGKIKEAWDGDRFLLELALYNVFAKVIDRHMKGGVIKIEFRSIAPHFQIAVFDNGFDLENAERNTQTATEPPNILNLDKAHLQEFVRACGWAITFAQRKGPFLNVTTLSIPRPVQADRYPNVVRLFSLQKEAALSLGQR